MITTTLALLMGTTLATTDAKAQFMEQYGPENAHRIAVTRDDNGNLQILFSNHGGPQRDGATEVIQATKFLDEDGKKSFLIMMQRPTSKVGRITEDEMAQFVAFMATYLEGEKTDVFLAAKSDAELEIHTETWYASIKDNNITATAIGKINDFVATGYGVYLLVDGQIGKIDAKQVDINLAGNVKSAFSGANKIAAVGQDTKLARGPKLELAPSQSVDTVAYVKNEDDVMKMVLLDANTLEEIKAIDFDGDYATAGHDDTVVYVVDIQNVGDGNETFEVARKPIEEFVAAA